LVGDGDDGLSEETLHREDECRAMVLVTWNIVERKMRERERECV
jgi:hypothetical protein